jgi:hypothetical protein
VVLAGAAKTSVVAWVSAGVSNGPPSPSQGANKKPPAEARGLSASVGPCPMPTAGSAMRGSELEG